MGKLKDGRTTDTRERILREARRLYFANGYEAMSMQIIADHLDISKATIFHHFKNKQELFFEMWLLAIAQFQQTLKGDVEQEGLPVRTKLRQIMQRMIRVPGLDIPHFAQDATAFLDQEQRETLQRAWRGNLMEIRQIFEEGIKRGELRLHNTLLATYMLLHMGILLPRSDAPRPFLLASLSQDEYIEALLEMILDGLNSEQGRQIST
jgi:AcrR family transcriptional regulator